MKVIFMSDKVPGEVPDGKFITQLISCIEGGEHIPDLDSLVMSEVVTERRIDALRIMELTLQAIDTLEKLNTRINLPCKSKGARDACRKAYCHTD